MVGAFFQVKAKRDREQMPLEERMKQFRELLTEKDISAYSPWEKELHKIVFDPRSGHHHKLNFFLLIFFVKDHLFTWRTNL